MASVDLDIGGMTCASCAARIEKKLNRLDGVRATVNYATETASVRYPATLTVDDLVATVARTGYTATVSTPAARPGDALPALRRRVLVSLALTVPVVALAMVSAWQFPGWGWVSLALAAPVVAYGGWPLHRAAWTNLRHGATTMDTLVSMGTLAAFGWSVWALASRAPGDEVYLETAAGVTLFVLAGRYAEARAKHRSGSALRALLELGAR